MCFLPDCSFLKSVERARIRQWADAMVGSLRAVKHRDAKRSRALERGFSRVRAAPNDPVGLAHLERSLPRALPGNDGDGSLKRQGFDACPLERQCHDTPPDGVTVISIGCGVAEDGTAVAFLWAQR